MASADQTAEDIVLSLLDLDHVDNVSLIEYAIENLTERDKDKLIANLKENYELYNADEAQEKFGGTEDE